MGLIRLLKNDLAKEVSTWADDQIISHDQAEEICARYGIDYHNLDKRSYGYFILISLGWLFVGLALITLIGANWEDIPRVLRMGTLIFLTLSVNLFGIYQVGRGRDRAATGCFFVGGLFYGASIMLIAQIYHIGEHFPDGIFWWAVGVLPMALLMQSTLIMILAFSLGYIWFFTESALLFYPALFPIFLGAAAWHVFRVKSSYIIFLALAAGIGFWLGYNYSWALGSFNTFEFGAENVLMGTGYFIFLYACSKWLGGQENSTLCDYGVLLGVWTLRLFVCALLVFSFEDPWHELVRANWDYPALNISIAAFFLIASTGVVYAAKRPVFTTIAFGILYLGVFTVLIVTENRGAEVYFQIADNVVLIITGIWLVIRGIQSSVSHYFYTGVFVILATGLLRYIDLVGDYIGAAVLFAVFALILLSAAKFWKIHHSRKEEAA